MKALNWSNDKKMLEYQLRQLYADVVRNHKLQEYQANMYMKRGNFLELMKIITTTVTTSGVIGVLIMDHNSLLENSTAIVSLIALFITTYTKTYNLNDLYKEYNNKALEFLDIRDRLLTLLYSLLLENINMNDLQEKRDIIVEDLKKVHMSTKDVSRRAGYFVSKSLKMDNNDIYSEEEIDAILPDILTFEKRKDLVKANLNVKQK